MPSPSPLYRGLVRLAVAALPLALPFSAKLRRGHEGRMGSLARLTEWGRRHRDRSRPLLWVHAPSVGEGRQAEAVLRRLKARHPDWQVVFTHFSPSAEALARGIGADVADYLPYDLPSAADALLEALSPTALVFCKLDLWPELATRAAARGVSVGMIAATVSPVSGRARWPARSLQRPGYAVVRAAGAVSEDDARRLEGLGVAADRIEVTGDPRFDSVAEIVAAVQPDDPVIAAAGPNVIASAATRSPALVAGSTWPADEQVLLEAFATVRAKYPDARLILVPHEPEESHLRRVERLAARLGVPTPMRLSTATGTPPLLLVDRVGILAKLYGAGTMAYVGGGFGRAGLHSVLEPAAWGLPVFFGPWWRNSREAGLLLEVGAAHSLPPRSAGAARPLAERWLEWLEREDERAAAGQRSLAVVRSGLGAADRNAALVERLVG